MAHFLVLFWFVFPSHSAGKLGFKVTSFRGFPPGRAEGVHWVDIKTTFMAPCKLSEYLYFKPQSGTSRLM